MESLVGAIKDDCLAIGADLDGFARGFFSAGVERPINGIAQLVSLGHLPPVHLYEPDASAQGAKKWFQQAGAAAGVIFDFVALSKLMGKVVGGGTGLESRLATSALTGLTYGGVLTPVAPGESQWNRLSNGVTQASAFVAFDAISYGLGTQVAQPTFLNTIARSGVAGAGAGVVHANVDSLTHGNGFASVSQMLNEGTTWGTGAAIMGGLGYLVSKGAEAMSERQANNNEAVLDQSQRVKVSGDGSRVSVRQLGDGKAQVESVELPNGSRIVRQGTGDNWVSNDGTPQRTEWQGDVRLTSDGNLQFVYKYQKAPNVVTVDLRMPDGSRVAVQGADGAIASPSAAVETTQQTLSDVAVSQMRKLNIDVNADRLQLTGVGGSQTGTVQTNYSLQLTEAEAAKMNVLAQQGSVKILPPSHSVPTGDVTAPTISGENLPGEYAYNRPMVDHASTVAFMFKGEGGRWKVLTGIRTGGAAAGQEALPGGFVDMNGSVVEDPAQTAIREVMEETGVKIQNPTLVRLGDALYRGDPRNRVIDFQYATVGKESDLATLFAGDDLSALHVRDVQDLLANPNSLAFDHNQMLQAAFDSLDKILAGAKVTSKP